MIKVFKALSSGVIFAFLYLLIVFVSPIIWMLIGYSNISSSPTLFGASLYIIEIKDQTFSSEATLLGFILCFVVGLIIHYFLGILISSFKKGSN